MEEAKRKRTSAKRMFTISEASLKRSLDGEEMAVATIQRRFDEFKQRWESLLDAHNDYADIAEDAKDNEGNLVDPNIDSWINEMVEKFESLEVEADKKLA